MKKDSGGFDRNRDRDRGGSRGKEVECKVFKIRNSIWEVFKVVILKI